MTAVGNERAAVTVDHAQPDQRLPGVAPRQAISK